MAISVPAMARSAGPSPPALPVVFTAANYVLCRLLLYASEKRNSSLTQYVMICSDSG